MIVKKCFEKKIGKVHVLNETPCQDEVAAISENGITVIALSDGAGSCKDSHIASKQAVNWALEYLVTNFEKIYGGNETNDMASFNENIIEVANAGRNCFNELDIPLEECCCTLLAIAISETGKWIGIHIGDGMIFKKDRELSILSQEEHGEYCNQTFFLNEEISSKHLRIYSGDIAESYPEDDKEDNKKRNITFLLTSDGCSSSLFDYSKKEITESVGVMMNWLENHEEDEVKKALERGLRDLFGNMSDDDLSIGIISAEF